MSGRNPKRLTTQGQPRKILARMRPAFEEHVRPCTRDREGERLGGGTILSAQWNHRLSRDIDVHLKLRTREDLRELLDRAAGACGGYWIDHPQFRRIEFERNKDNHIDISLNPPTPKAGEHTAVVDGVPILILSNAQIMAGKLTGRGMNSPVRDLFDIAVCAKADPEALEVAVNLLPDEDADSILKIYELTSAQYANEASDLEVVAQELKPLCENPAPYARNAILDAKYREMTLRTADGTAEATTRTGFGERCRHYRTAEELADGMERHGFNGFLQAQYRDHEAVLEDTKNYMLDRRDAVVIAVRPRSLDHDRIDIPEIAWSPPEGDGRGFGPGPAG